jgi:hypothetical protein
MKLVMTLAASADEEVLDAQLAFHLNAGVDVVIAAVDPSQAATTDVLEPYERQGYVHRLFEPGPEVRTRMARLAATEHGAEWVINCDSAEFWWPRGESLKEVLAPIPQRYTVVQGLRRLFLPRPGGGFFAERMTERRSIEDAVRAVNASPAALLRPLHRADDSMVVAPDGAVTLKRNVPMRAWYPIEVFDFASRGGDDRADPPVVDTRLRDALRVLRDDASTDAFALPADGAGRITFRTPDIVDDAAYAVECAEVGEVDLAKVERYVTQLEERVARLEARLGPRVLRKLSSLLGRRP